MDYVLLNGFFSETECDKYRMHIDQVLGPVDVSSNTFTIDPHDRVRVVDLALSNMVCSRLQSCHNQWQNLASTVGFNSDCSDSYTVNHQWFFTRYPPGGHLGPHVDGTIWGNHRKSMLTLLIYINDDYLGGNTQFLDDYSSDETTIIASVKPIKGLAMLLRQDVLHKGDTITHGVKYILRSDIMIDDISSNTTTIPSVPSDTKTVCVTKNDANRPIQP